MSGSLEEIEDLFSQLLGSARRHTKRACLERIHAICGGYFRQKVKISNSLVGGALEAEGLLGRKTLGTAQSSDYRCLIKAWRSFQIGLDERVNEKGLVKKFARAWIANIADPALRQLVNDLAVRNNHLGREVEMLKKTIGTISVDLRASSQSLQAQIDVGACKLQRSEILALSKAMSDGFLREMNWHKGPGGSILSSVGRELLPPGYLSGMEKLLKSGAGSG